jgi:hypothetical protein
VSAVRTWVLSVLSVCLLRYVEVLKKKKKEVFINVARAREAIYLG